MAQYKIYLDYAAATPVAAEVSRVMKPHWASRFANPSSIHGAGQIAAKAVRENRKKIARFLNCHEKEIIFTSGGTESINLALQGCLNANSKRGQHIISTAIEHTATLSTLKYLKKNSGHSVTLAPCDVNGVVRTHDVLRAVTNATALVAVIFTQNEIGTVQPVAEIGRELERINRVRKQKGLKKILYHLDACQAPPFYKLDVEKLHCDLLSLDAGKMYGPRGVGMLYIRKRTPIEPQIHGGGQEQGYRSGTEPVALIAGCSAAFDYVNKRRTAESTRLTKLRDYMIQRLEVEVQSCRVTGRDAQRAPNIVHATIANREGEDLVLRLDRVGIACSTGSACSQATGVDSHVVRALRLPPARRAGSLRFSFGYATTKKDIDCAINSLVEIAAEPVNRL